LLLSRGGDQMVFIHGFRDFNSHGELYRTLESQRLRLRTADPDAKGDPETYSSRARRWDPMMLADYAKQAGIILRGIKTFTERYEALQAARRAGAK